MTRMSMPPGFRFHPTDVELIKYYLKRKSLGKKLRFEAITEVNIYNYAPWDLPDKSCLKNKDLEWFFFCPISRKYASGVRFSRATETGYWKATGKDRAIVYNGQAVGMVKTLVFHQGHAPKGDRTDWVMHEYRILENELADSGINQAAYVLVKIFKKSGPGPKNGAQYGAPFNEEEWNADDSDDELGLRAETLQPSSMIPHSAVANNNSRPAFTSTYVYGSTSNVFQQPPDYSRLSALTHNINSVETYTQSSGFHCNSVKTHTQSTGFHCNSVGTSSFVLGGTSNTYLQPLSAVSHNNNSYVDTATQYSSLPLTATLNTSLISGTFFPGGTSSFVLGGTSSGPVQGAPSTVVFRSNDLPVGEEVDIDSLLAMFRDDDDLPAMPSDFNEVNQVNGEEFMELNDIYADLDDLADWDELGRIL